MKSLSLREATSFACEGALVQPNTQPAESQKVGLQSVPLLDRGNAAVLLRRQASGLPRPLSGSR
jgi:hypothetical protein